ncbi:RNA polymerase sigma-70 factor [Sphingobacterium sp. SYP-B4668]|uniref:RNA polymerase sigma-70 factor n=1 Tax=Sphingobacterium sp. SYP-B4668 TaxID=2996035 RepID=UPI0022DD5444|nr:RNA polymerase sigma-70 factor [Sphingobacterium sp. SYP-B4668]
MIETDIVEGLKAGNNLAYKILYDMHYVTLCKYASKITHSPADAAHVVNEVIFSIWKNRDNLEIQHLRHYLLRAVRNRSLTFVSNKKKYEGIHIEIEEESNDFRQAEWISADGPIEKLLVKELDIKILKSLNGMPVQTKEIFMLSRFKNQKYHEIAKQLNISSDVVKYHIKQALRKLRIDLQDYFSKKNTF